MEIWNRGKSEVVKQLMLNTTEWGHNKGYYQNQYPKTKSINTERISQPNHSRVRFKPKTNKNLNGHDKLTLSLGERSMVVSNLKHLCVKVHIHQSPDDNTRKRDVYLIILRQCFLRCVGYMSLCNPMDPLCRKRGLSGFSL